ncbi:MULTISPECIES: hypothetical protein [Pseudomonas aeruginosa group]|nr:MULTISPECIES: hypothetical protein [Pseudomonas aeruginosa group]MCW8360416.1 hypothetical protein [Pseudomonas aeruginosa]MCW8365528.1 hypothetical protein [Pseudomonas aeruginosa]MCW8412831.1 hypothetical protein [Pseudomonas aeruginosa]MCX3378653.1 hypothetical protein [Pseudomonas aeruginosa]NQA99701.1 hypothetical protein [Pseudomonas paraeruginosa]
MKYPFSVLFLSLSLLPGSTPPAWIAACRFGSGSHLPASLGCPTERGSCTVGQRQWLQRRNGFYGVHECLERIDDFSRPRHRPLAVAAMGELQRAIGKAAQENPEFPPGKSPCAFSTALPAAELVNRDEHGGGPSTPGYDRLASRCPVTPGTGEASQGEGYGPEHYSIEVGLHAWILLRQPGGKTRSGTSCCPSGAASSA